MDMYTLSVNCYEPADPLFTLAFDKQRLIDWLLFYASE